MRNGDALSDNTGLLAHPQNSSVPSLVCFHGAADRWLCFLRDGT